MPQWLLLTIGGGLGAAVFLLAVGAAVRAGKRAQGGGGALCDTCTLNDPRYCSRPDRPEARRCDDYKGPPRG
jgi:hypothetical protein